MSGLPPMRPLVIVLKVFLQQRELNEVYSGGIGSYALLVMVAAFLQTHRSRWQRGGGLGREGEIEGSLGVLLVDFMRLYGAPCPPPPSSPHPRPFEVGEEATLPLWIDHVVTKAISAICLTPPKGKALSDRTCPHL